MNVRLMSGAAAYETCMRLASAWLQCRNVTGQPHAFPRVGQRRRMLPLDETLDPGSKSFVMSSIGGLVEGKYF